ncbi:FtsX-like permease family protein [Haladaptatus cibarius]|uniref:FtsX-like permease family protein n=1 Tax=Haladaptatus cibarius TaxID=453847 RepID=UPI000678C0C9|nr:FtsX-like permease family protein [Haladaptatus cibarius]
MGYRRLLLTRWSRRDSLAIVVIATTVAFLTGTTLVVGAMGAQTAAIADEYDVNGQAIYYESMASAQASNGDDALVVPVAVVTEPNDTDAYVVGVPSDTTREFRNRTSIAIASPPQNGVALESIRAPTNRTLAGTNARRTVQVVPQNRSNGIFPPHWYTASTETVERFGVTGAFVVEPPSSSNGGGTPLRSAFSFFVIGTQHVLSVLQMMAIGVGIIVGVVVFGITRMTVRDRLRAIRVIRSTGGSRRSLVLLFGARTGALALVGTLLGYAAGVILTNVAVSIGVSAGVPTSLQTRVTTRLASVLLPMYAGIVVIGVVAGVLAVRPAVQRLPARADSLPNGRKSVRIPSRNRDLGSLSVLDWRLLVPSLGTLAVFVTAVILVASVGTVVATSTTTSGTTISDPNAAHPIASKIPAEYANVLRKQGMSASPEILSFTVHEGQPMLVRGADYSSFENVSGATLESGQRPQHADEAVVGADLARTLNIELNETLTVGGSTDTAVARVRVVGMYSATGTLDDQLLVSLPVARHLSRVEQGRVHLIRTANSTEQFDARNSVAVLDVTTPSTVTADNTMTAQIHLKNFGTGTATRTIPIRFGAYSDSVTTSVKANERITVTAQIPTNRTGTFTLRVGSYRQPVSVAARDSIAVRGVPKRAPPGSTPLVRVVNATGAAIENASVSVGNETVRTDGNGRVRVRFAATGPTTVQVEHGNKETTQEVLVSEQADRTLSSRFRVEPKNPGILTRPSARLTLYNPWNETLQRTVELVDGTETHRRTLTLSPGARRPVVVRLDRKSPGSHQLTATADGRTLAQTKYVVSGDERVVAAVASGGAEGTSAIGTAVRTVFGNLSLLVVVVLCLAGAMTVGGTTATVAYVVHSHRRSIGIRRATGASHKRVLSLLLEDALKVGVVAVSGALGVATLVVVALSRSGQLVFYGVRAAPSVTAPVIIGVVAGCFGLLLVSVFVVAKSLLAGAPAPLLVETPARERRAASGDDADE